MLFITHHEGIPLRGGAVESGRPRFGCCVTLHQPVDVPDPQSRHWQYGKSNSTSVSGWLLMLVTMVVIDPLQCSVPVPAGAFCLVSESSAPWISPWLERGWRVGKDTLAWRSLLGAWRLLVASCCAHTVPSRTALSLAISSLTHFIWVSLGSSQLCLCIRSKYLPGGAHILLPSIPAHSWMIAQGS